MTRAFTIRAATTDDAAALIEYGKTLAGEPENNILFNSADEFTFTVEQEISIVQSYIDAPAAHWLVAVDEAGMLIGSINVAPGRRALGHTVSLGMTVAKDWRDQGVGTRLMREMLAWCEANPHVKRLELEVFSENARAIHLYEKLGFAREGIRRAAALKAGRFRDLLIMAVLYPRPDLGI
jgi:RimJ/RimL family protein N-acetyltransferase